MIFVESKRDWRLCSRMVDQSEVPGFARVFIEGVLAKGNKMAGEKPLVDYCTVGGTYDIFKSRTNHRYRKAKAGSLTELQACPS